MAETNERSYFIDRTFTTTRMVRQRGIEPPALGLEVLCSIQLSYWRILVLKVGFEPTRLAATDFESAASAIPPRQLIIQSALFGLIS